LIKRCGRVRVLGNMNYTQDYDRIFSYDLAEYMLLAVSVEELDGRSKRLKAEQVVDSENVLIPFC